MTTDLWARLVRRRILTDTRVGAALRDVPASAFVRPPLGEVLPVDAPVATSLDPPRFMLPPPRVLVMLLQMLELEKGVKVLLLGSTGGYVEALVARLTDPAPVTVWEEDAGLAAATRSALAANGAADRVSFVGAPAGDRFDRVTTADGIARLEPRAKEAIADMGFALYRSLRDAPQFVKVLRSGSDYLELATSDAGPTADADSRRRLDVGRELLLGRMLENAWDRRVESEHDRHFAEVVDETFAHPELLPPMSPDARARYDAARVLFHFAYIYQSAGDFETAIDVYRASLAVRPTAEAHTFLGWVYSFEDRYEEAIAECEEAIATDPTFGNPYNDIGAYLIELNRPDEAIPWFEKAKRAERYCCHFYAYSNLGRVYLMKGLYAKARKEFREALRINPQYSYAREMLRRVERGSDYIA